MTNTVILCNSDAEKVITLTDLLLYHLSGVLCCDWMSPTKGEGLSCLQVVVGGVQIHLSFVDVVYPSSYLAGDRKREDIFKYQPSLKTLHEIKHVPSHFYAVVVFFPQTGSHPDVQCDGLPLLKTQVQFGPWISELGVFTEFVLLFDPSAEQREHKHTISTNTEINRVFQQFSERKDSVQLSVRAELHLSDTALIILHSLTWNGPVRQRWSQKRPLGLQNQLL